jgi:hypothetical protein
MNADSHVEVFLGRAELDGDRVALGDLARVRTGHVQTNDTLLVKLVADELGVADVVGFVGDGPLERPKVDMVDLDVLGAQGLDGLLFREANVAVLERGEYGGRHGIVVHLDVTAAEETPGEQLTGLDGDRCQLEHAVVGRALVDTVANCEYIRNIRLLKGCCDLLISIKIFKNESH